MAPPLSNPTFLLGLQADLSDEDYSSEVTHAHAVGVLRIPPPRRRQQRLHPRCASVQAFSMKTFAGPVFARLRRSLGISQRDYVGSVCSESCYLQFISNSKSDAHFFLT